MKTVTMDKDHDYHVNPQTTVAYKAGETYKAVPNAHADEIVAQGKGRVISEEADEPEQAQTQAEGRRRGRG